MSDRDLFGDVRQTGEEASRWLDALERDASATFRPRDSIRTRGIRFVLAPSADHPRLVAGCIGLFWPDAWVRCFDCFVWKQRTVHVQRHNELDFDIVWIKVVPSGQWWPVLGPANARLVSTIKTDYCGDAYINEQGALQIASFSTENAARDFAAQISRATGANFRVGQSRGW